MPAGGTAIAGKECSRFGRGEAGEWLYLEAVSLDDLHGG
jgi:hypothetical protein